MSAAPSPGAESNPHALSYAQDSSELFDVMLPPPSSSPIFDIYSDRPVPSGRRRTRGRVHSDGDWHRSVHVWIVDPARSLVVMQKRSEAKDTFPGRWDISAAGHVEAGVDDSRETAGRELAEELGIVLDGEGAAGKGGGSGDDDDDDGLEFAFTVPAEQHRLGGCNCFEDVYFLRRNSEDTVFVVGEAEVSAVRWVGVADLERALREGDEAYVPRVQRYLEAFFRHVKKVCQEEKGEQ
eukprot:CAMPEP_0113535562 /NCGR_PEP_ID=MMETSP0015_2-20120614/5777_1 /TAXON_ID=2838 /ORGANISM="Odontella" /LENGTH=237 /DNA_ID=CAMNT_0000434835 /DNA_START=176 /DNA_END=889 /DNA_ORIENTATION=+ /assembly_acc=CAM_ASM_000160